MFRAFSCSLIIAGGTSCAAAGVQDQAPVRVERSVVLMGTVARFVAEDIGRQGALEQLERMVGVVEEVEAEISTWRGDSHYSRINRQPLGMALTIPSRPCRILRRARQWWQETDGTFDPSVGSLAEIWGLRGGGRRPEQIEIEAAMGRTGFGRIRFGRNECEVTRLSEVKLDAGAFGKGAALDAVRRAMGDEPGRWLVDFGGQVAASAGEWPVALAHPERRDEPTVELLLTGGSLATSGGTERDLTTSEGHRVGHILDPRTGRPAPWRASVSVWHASALDADALSTALHVMGPDAGLAWAAERALAACFLVATDAGDLVVRATPQFERLFQRSPGNFD